MSYALVIEHAAGNDLRALRTSLPPVQRPVAMEAVERELSRLSADPLPKASEYLGRKLEKEAFEAHLDTLTILIEDLFHLKLNGSEESLTNADVVDRLRRVAENTTIEQMTEWADRIEQIFVALPRNVNRNLAMDAMLIMA